MEKENQVLQVINGLNEEVKRSAVKKIGEIVELLQDRERLISFLPNAIDDDGRQGYLLLTDKRVILNLKGFLLGRRNSSIDLSKIGSVETKSSLMSIKLEIVGSGINEDLKFYNSAGLKEFTQCIREQLGGSHQKQTGPAISPATDIVELLERLVTLREKGVLTEEEFITEKKKILSK